MNKIKLFSLLGILLAASVANAASIKEIFQSIADTAVTGNGGSHYVTFVKPEKYSEAKEIRKLEREANASDNDCKYTAVADIDAALKEISKSWDDERTANRLEGMKKQGLIKQIIYSDWDPSSGDSEYCLISTIKVFAVDGSVLVLDYNETD